MSKHRYHFNPESLSYHKVVPTLKKRIVRILYIVITAAVISAIYYTVYSFFFDTPIEKKLKHENKLLSKQYRELNKRYEEVQEVVGDIQTRDENIYRVIFEAEPYKDSVFLAGGTYALKIEEIEGKDNTELIKQSQSTLERVNQKGVPATYSLLRRVEQLSARLKDSVDFIPSIIPLESKDIRQLAAPQGIRIHPFYKTLKMHNGVDFTAPAGSAVLAAAEGTVVKIDSRRSSGNSVLINHGNGYMTFYAHLERVTARRGARVKKGAQIGTVGSSGMSVAPHLHYEVVKNNRPVNPAHFFFADISPADYHRLIQKVSRSGQSLD
ncbi:M23 family metallopeptidase [Alistipes sp. ZOR0009]|jgi:murein DD-endopeptidase MepM/ murein hydrolase activator NlpD|uniref:M23 family metallopeptidase n=1 Tax=Alistipes sp. ZOR0009 TaxID=1339253 RepID=UPI000647DA7D|nr:M23 family metallopeptidase [Alistipes sp. ZOR0009]